MTARQSQTFAPALAAVVLLLFLLLYLKPYHGIRHDAVLYLGQALMHLYPEQFSGDLFFAYGSQAQFTLFPQAMAWLLGYFNPAQIFQALTLAGLLLFLLASALLLSRILPKGQVFYALCALLLMPGVYGGNRIFTYAEPFFTGRSIAEPLLLIMFATWFVGRKAVAASLWLLAALIHPLQAFSAALVLWLVLVWQDRRWLHMLWLVFPVLLMASAGFAPFDKLLSRYDAEWLAWVMERTPQVFLTSWRLGDWGYWLTDVFLGWLILRKAQGPLKLFCQAALVATCAGLVATLILADGLNLILPTGMQFWRVQWLLHWLVMACLPLTLYEEYQQGGGLSPRWWLLLAIALFGVSAGTIAPSPLAVLPMIPLYLAWPRIEKKVGARFWRCLCFFMPAVPLLGLAKYALGVIKLYEGNNGARELFRPEFVLFSYPLVAGAIVASGLWAWKYKPRWRVPLISLLVFMLLHAVAAWDRRSPWTRNIESFQHTANIFNVDLPAGSQIFWDGELLAPWMILNRSSYYDRQQSAGLAFNRGNAAEAMRRKSTLDTFWLQQQICSWVDGLNQVQGVCQISNEAIAEACARSEGKLDYLVLQNKLDKQALGVWSIARGMKDDQPVNYHLYACADFVASGRVRFGDAPPGDVSNH